jgi:hypothetical protein
MLFGSQLFNTKCGHRLLWGNCHMYQLPNSQVTQIDPIKEVNYVSHDVVEECIGTTAVFGVTLGDIVADDPALFEEVSQSIAQIGIPWNYVFGNHDHNRD